MVVSQIKGQIRLMKKYEDSPQFIMLHVAGNDFGLKKSRFYIYIYLFYLLFFIFFYFLFVAQTKPIYIYTSEN